MYPANRQSATRQYQASEVQHRVESADPWKLIQLMMARVVAKLGMAKLSLEQGDIPAKAQHTSDAINVISALQVALDFDADPALAGNLHGLYDYMSRQLLSANLKNDAAIFDEVSGLMRELKSAWDAIDADTVAGESAG